MTFNTKSNLFFASFDNDASYSDTSISNNAEFTFAFAFLGDVFNFRYL